MHTRAYARKAFRLLTHGPAMPWDRWYIRTTSAALLGDRGGYIPWHATFREGRNEVAREMRAVRRLAAERYRDQNQA